MEILLIAAVVVSILAGLVTVLTGLANMVKFFRQWKKEDPKA